MSVPEPLDVSTAPSNLAHLPQLNLDSTLKTLETRWRSGETCTLAHTSALVFVNPQRALPSSCTTPRAEDFNDFAEVSDERVDEMYTGRKILHAALTSNRYQAVLVSGESGAGKTEMTKKLLYAVASLDDERRRRDNDAECSSENAESASPVPWKRQSSSILRSVLAANPLLEAFGNASTQANANSSRFVKLTTFHLGVNKDSEDKSKKVLLRASTKTMLFEKSRAARRDPNERNFHALYQLVAGLQQDQKPYAEWLGLANVSSQDLNLLRMEKLDANMFKEDVIGSRVTMHALCVARVGFQARHLLLRCLAAVLHLGQLDFVEQNNRVLLSAGSEEPMLHAARLLNHSIDELNQALRTRVVSVNSEHILVPNTLNQCISARDGLIKELYAATFQFVVKATDVCSTTSEEVVSSKISFLDVMGFETKGAAQLAGFEQLLVNYVNEKLHGEFLGTVLKDAMREYAEQGVALPALAYEDNADSVSFLEHGLFALLEDEHMLSGTDLKFFSKSKAKFESKSARFSSTKTTLTSFQVQHYAGRVEYDATGFMSKNRDQLNSGVLKIVHNVSKMLEAHSALVFVDSKPSGSSSLAQHFKHELNWLIHEELAKADRHYVRCIRPNRSGSSTDFDRQVVAAQIQAAGVIAAVEMSRFAYPHRLSLKTFPMTYRRLRLDSVLREFPRGSAYAVGKTVFYCNDEVYRALERARVTSSYNAATAWLERVKKVKIDRASLRNRAATRVQCLLRRRLALRARAALAAERRAAAEALEREQLLASSIPPHHHPEAEEEVSRIVPLEDPTTMMMLQETRFTCHDEEEEDASSVLTRESALLLEEEEETDLPSASVSGEGETMEETLARLQFQLAESNRCKRELEIEVARLRSFGSRAAVASESSTSPLYARPPKRSAMSEMSRRSSRPASNASRAPTSFISRIDPKSDVSATLSFDDETSFNDENSFQASNRLPPGRGLLSTSKSAREKTKGRRIVFADESQTHLLHHDEGADKSGARRAAPTRYLGPLQILLARPSKQPGAWALESPIPSATKKLAASEQPPTPRFEHDVAATILDWALSEVNSTLSERSVLLRPLSVETKRGGGGQLNQESHSSMFEETDSSLWAASMGYIVESR